MSVFVVTNGHIDVLVAGLFEYGVVDSNADPRQLGQDLWEENVRCVSHNWDEWLRILQYELHTTEAPLHPTAVLKATHGYSYNSSQYPGWKDSGARELTQRLELAIGSRYPMNYVLYERMPAHFQKLDEALRSAWEVAGA